MISILTGLDLILPLLRNGLAAMPRIETQDNGKISLDDTPLESNAH